MNVMDKIWDKNSFEVGGHWPLWRGWKNRMTMQNRPKSNAKKQQKKTTTSSSSCHRCFITRLLLINHSYLTKYKTCSVVRNLLNNSKKCLNTCYTCNVVFAVQFHLVSGVYFIRSAFKGYNTRDLGTVLLQHLRKM